MVEVWGIIGAVGFVVGAAVVVFARFMAPRESLRERTKERDVAVATLDSLSDAHRAAAVEHQRLSKALCKIGNEIGMFPPGDEALESDQSHFRVGDAEAAADAIIEEWRGRESALWSCIKGEQGLYVPEEDKSYHPGREIEVLRCELADLRDWFQCSVCEVTGEADGVCEFCDGAGPLVERAWEGFIELVESLNGSPVAELANGIQALTRRVDCKWEVRRD